MAAPELGTAFVDSVRVGDRHREIDRDARWLLREIMRDHASDEVA
jgi:hypothetical protein